MTGRRLAAGLLLLAVVCAGVVRQSRKDATLTVGVYSGSYWGTPTASNCYQVLDHAIERFEGSHPGVKVTYISGIPPESYSEWLAEQLLLGTEPDVFFVFPEDFSLLASSGALENLGDLIAQDPDFSADAFYGPCFRSGYYSGGQYALPYESTPTMMFVNRTLLEENNIPLPDNDWTWDDFYRICQQVTRPEERRFGVYGYTWLNALYTNGVTLFSEDGRSCSLADEKVDSAIRFVKSLRQLNGGYTVTARDFDLGSVAFRPFLFSEYRAYQPYPWRVKKYSGFEWGCVSMPAGEDGGNVSELHTLLVGISARTSRRSLAWQFAKLLTLDEEVQRELHSCSSGISPLRRVAGDVDFDQAVIREIMDSAVAVPGFDGYQQALMIAENAVAEELSGETSQKNRLLTAQREINIFLNQ